MSLIHLTADNFENEVLKSKTPVIVDFWAEWCPPCRMLGPIFEDLSNEKSYDGKLKFAKLDTEEVPEIASQYSIMSIPALLVFRGDKVIGTMVGALPKEQLKKKIDEILKKK